MSRALLLFSALCIATLTSQVAQAASLKEEQLAQRLQQLAQASSQGTPRNLNEQITDNGFSVDGITLVNHLSVSPEHAAQMQDYPNAIREQLTASVCRTPNFISLLRNGAQLRYEFTEKGSNRLVAVERYDAADCSL